MRISLTVAASGILNKGRCAWSALEPTCETLALTPARRPNRRMLNADVSFLNDPIFRQHVLRFADDQAAFFVAFQAAFAKLGELGWTNLAPVSYSIPAAHSWDVKSTSSMREVQVKPGLRLSWRLNDDGNVSVALTLNSIVGWMGFAVSKTGRMVFPTPSRAVVGTSSGVQRRRLVAQVIPNVTHTAPVEEVQDLLNASFAHADGSSILQFTTSLAWFMQYSDPESSGTAWFLYSHGTPGNANEEFGYHGLNRGNLELTRFDSPHHVPQQALSPPPPLASSFTPVTRTFVPGPDAKLTWSHHANQTTT